MIVLYFIWDALVRFAAFIVRNWKIAVPVIVVLILVIVFTAKCGRKPTIDLESVEKINRGNEVLRKQELQKVITENADVVVAVDSRTAIAETSVAERDFNITEKVKEADRKIQQVKAQKGDVTQAELVCLLTGEGCL